MRFLSTPHLPKSVVKLCAVGEGYPELNAALHRTGIKVLSVPASKNLSRPVQTHADLLLHHAGGRHVWLETINGKFAQVLKSLGFQIHGLSTPLAEQYPKDIALCTFPLKGIVWGNIKAIDPFLLNYYQFKGLDAFHVRQGYTKCNCCIIDDSSVITSDTALAKYMRMHHIDVLEIQAGYIELPGYSHGFIGGCCALISPEQLICYGNLDSHPNAAKIKAFCHKKGVAVKSICVQFPLTDIGGIIPLVEVSV